MKKLLKYILFPFLVVAILFFYSFSVMRNQAKKVEEIEVEFEAGENSFLTHKLVNKLLIQNEEPVKNQTKSVLDLHKLENTVLSNPYIENATVFLTPGGLLKAQVKQREPIARIITDTEVYYVDRYGVKMPLSEHFSARVPLVFGVESSSNIDEITELVRLIFDDEFLKKEIVSIERLTSNEYEMKVRSGDYKIDFGKFTRVDEKVKKIKAFYNKALVDNSIGNYETINVKYRNQVVCTKQSQDGKQ